MCAVTDVGGKRRSRVDCVGDFLRRGAGVSNAHHYAFPHQSFDEARRIRPFGRQRYQPDVPSRGFLEAVELIQIRWPDPSCGMRAAWPVFRRNVWSLQVESFHGRAFPHRFFRAGEIRERARHIRRRSGDHGGEEASDTGL